MKILALILFPFILNSQVVTSNSNSVLTFGDSSIPASKVTGLATLLNSKATTSELNTKMNIWYAADAQANDSYVITLSPVPASYTTGMMIVFKAATANTTGATLNVNSLGVKNIIKRVNTTLATGDILQGMLCWLVYDGVNFCLLNPVVN
jgi:hypothetical protein